MCQIRIQKQTHDAENTTFPKAKEPIVNRLKALSFIPAQIIPDCKILVDANAAPDLIFVIIFSGIKFPRTTPAMIELGIPKIGDER